MIAAWLVHLYTASSAVLAFLALRALEVDDYRLAFLWLFVAIVVDSTDGWLARAARVAEKVPWLSGAHLDDIVDYLTYVFVPAVLLYRSGQFPVGGGIGLVAVILLASAYGFARLDAKTDDHFFTGFPSYWNITAFYLYAASLPPIVNAAIVVTLASLVFVPIGYVYPSRTPVLRSTTIALCAAWGAVLLFLVWQLPSVSRPLLAASLFFPIYYVVLSLVLHSRRDPGLRDRRTHVS